MKKLITVALSLILMVGLSCVAIAGSLDSPGAPSAGSGMYTLQNLYDYLTSGTALTVQSSFQEPTSGPGSTMKTTKQIGDAVATPFALCATTTAANVESGKPFFCTQPGSWGVQTGTYVGPPTPTPTQTPIYASCKAIKTAIPTAGDGVYTIDPDGAGGADAFSAYCDMTTDGGGWTLVVRIKDDSGHKTAAATGTLSDPSQSTSAKLSDVVINTLAAQYYRFNCGVSLSTKRYFDATQHPFDASGANHDNTIYRSAATLGGQWCDAAGSEFTLCSYNNCAPYLIYSTPSRGGCDHVDGEDWGSSGAVWAR